MLCNYEVYYAKRKLNKTKLIVCILILILVVLLSTFLTIKIIENENYKKTLEEDIRKAEEEKIIEQKRIEEEQIKEQQRIKDEKIKSDRFSDEQLNTFENIYNETEQKQVFLTFDDGPTQSVTPLILDLLKEQNIKATFFVLGNRATANNDLIQREYNEGHYIANHGYTHKYSQIYQNPQNVLDEYNYTESCIQQALGNENYHSKVFRFPGGSQGGYYSSIKRESKQLLLENGIASLDWNALSKDAEGAETKEQLFQNVIETVGDKQSVVILMHDSSDKILTYEVLADVIQYLRENGYEFKNLYDII